MVECVAKWNIQAHWEFVGETLKIKPLVVCSSRHSYANRERTYWVSWWEDLQEPSRAAAMADDILDAGRVAVDKHGLRVPKLATLMANANSWNTTNPVWDTKAQQFDTLRPHEAERALEIPVGHTARAPQEERLTMVGNAFNVRTAAEILAMGRHRILGQTRMNNRGGQTKAT